MALSRRSFIRYAQALLVVTVLAVLCGCELLAGLQAEPASSQQYQLKAMMLDVGQGDSILLASGGQYMLIDAGENDRGDDVVADLKGMGVTKLAVVVGTHPHSDHIGGLDTVIKAIPVDAIYMPRRTADTETYEDVLDAAEARGLKITVPKPGDRMKLGEAEIEFLWPPADYESDNDNNYSIVMRVTAGGHSILLCGDIEKNAEKGLLDSGADISCDVLKVAHHGSDTSSTAKFLEACTPKIALISVGRDNNYKHPDKDVLKMLQNSGAAVHRTDLNGTITVIVSDGKLTVQDSK